MAGTFETVTLRTPPLPELVPAGVFDAFGWCESTSVDWRKPAGPLAEGEAIDGANPRGLAFVFRGPSEVDLPRELARVHVPRLSEDHEWVLAPYAIDDATDGLYEARVRPSDVFLLAADRLTSLVWGLHDWAHFHNHGPFEARAQTELQCDATALVWLAINDAVLGLGAAALERTRAALVRLSLRRFAEENRPFDEAWLAPERLATLLKTARG
jgi:hypothetical protein